MKNLLAIACAFGLFSGAVAAPKKVVMIAGKQSHGLCHMSITLESNCWPSA